MVGSTLTSCNMIVSLYSIILLLELNLDIPNPILFGVLCDVFSVYSDAFYECAIMIYFYHHNHIVSCY